MSRIKLVVAYDGTNYSGWQYQPNNETIEGVLNRELSELLKENIIVIGASRTDAGVHALGNVAVFDTNTCIPPEKLAYALNSRMPEDIVVESSCEVVSDFHPRHCETKKTYEYRIFNGEMENPLKRRYFYHVRQRLDIEKMRRAAEYIIGEHDFMSFCAAGATVQTTVRTIYELCVEQNENDIIIRIKGNGFLYNMVRIIAGTLIRCGLGKQEPSELKSIIDAKDRSMAGPTAPARGLTLVKIEYKTTI